MRARAENGKVVLEWPGRGGWGSPAAEPFETLTVPEATALALDLNRAIAAAAPQCTGLAATWCPVHGDCTCPRDGEHGGDIDFAAGENTCPLHSHASTHAE